MDFHRLYFLLHVMKNPNIPFFWDALSKINFTSKLTRNIIYLTADRPTYNQQLIPVALSRAETVVFISKQTRVQTTSLFFIQVWITNNINCVFLQVTFSSTFRRWEEENQKKKLCQGVPIHSLSQCNKINRFKERLGFLSIYCLAGK